MHRRHEARRSLSVALLLAPLLGLSSRARAEPLAFESSPRCGPRPSFASDVRRLVGRDADDRAELTLAVRLADTRRGVRVELRAEQAGQTTRRTLELEGCAAAYDAAVLLAALTIDPQARLPAQPGDSGGRDPSQPIALPAAPLDAAPPTAPDPVPNSPAGRDGPETAPGAPPDGIAPPDDLPPGSPTAPPALPESRPRHWWRPTWGAGSFVRIPVLVRVSGALDPRQFGGPSGALSAEGGLGLGTLEAAVGARYGLPHRLADAPGGADVSVSSVLGFARAGYRAVRGPVAFIPYAALGLGALFVDADRVRIPSLETAFVAELAAGALLELALGRNVALDVGGELVVPTRRPVLRLDGAEWFALPPVAGRIAVGVRFWSLFP